MSPYRAPIGWLGQCRRPDRARLPLPPKPVIALAMLSLGGYRAVLRGRTSPHDPRIGSENLVTALGPGRAARGPGRAQPTRRSTKRTTTAASWLRVDGAAGENRSELVPVT